MDRNVKNNNKWALEISCHCLPTPAESIRKSRIFYVSGGIEKCKGHEIGSPATKYSRNVPLLDMTLR